MNSSEKKVNLDRHTRSCGKVLQLGDIYFARMKECVMQQCLRAGWNKSKELFGILDGRNISQGM